MNNILSFIFKLFRVKSLSIYQLTLILIFSSSIISIIIISTGWAISENNEFQKKISLLKEDAIEKQKEKLNEEVKRLISYLEFTNKDTIGYTQDQLKDKALRYFESIRFGNDGYVFVNTYNGNALLFNGKKLAVPNSMIHLTDPNGINLYKTEMSLVELPNGGYFKYEFMKIDDDRTYPKMSYVIGFDKWEWILGAGDYLDNLDNEIIIMEKELKNNLYREILLIIAIFIPILILLALLSIFPANFIQNQFNKFVHFIKNPSPDLETQIYLNKILIRDLEIIGKEIIQNDELVKQFGHIIDESNNEIYIFSKEDLKIIHANKGAIQNSGYSESEIKKMTFLDIITNISHEQFLNIAKPLNENQANKINFETFYKSKNEIIFSIEVNLTLSVFDNKEVYVAIFYDVTERRLAEENLITSKKRLNEAELLGQLGNWSNEVATGEIIWSDGMYAIFGRNKKKDTLTYDNIISWIHPDDREHHNRFFEQMINLKSSNEIEDLEYRLVRPDGMIRWVKVRYQCEFDKNQKPKLFFGTILDITDSKQAELELQKSEEQSRALFEFSVIGILIADENSYYFDANPSMCNMLGYTREELIGLHAKDIVLQTEIVNIQPALNIIKSKKYYNKEWHFKRKDGSTFIAEVGVSKLPDGNLIAMINDITDRKQVEDELKKYREHLEGIIGERTIALSNSQDALLNLVDDLNIQANKIETTNKQLASKNEELETFTYSVSHDLKAPLRGIDGYSQLLLENYKDSLSTEAQEFLMNIRYGTEQMNVLIEDLLAYSRMERREFHMDKINLTPLIYNIIHQFSKVIKENKIQVKVSISEEFKLIADKEGLQLAIRNLVDNAIKFSKNNKNAKIEIGAEENDSFWRIFVKDNGIGFDMKYHDRIFKIFQRLHLAEEYEGTGIGLAMVSKAMQRMNGRVWANSNSKNNTCFYLEINKSN